MPTSAALSRRQFLRITAIAGLGLGVAGRLLANHGTAEVPQYHTVRETRMVMGSVANLTLLTNRANASEARQALDATFARMATLERIFSRHQPESALSRLNRDGRLSSSPPELREVLGQSIDYGELTGGAFDVSVEPLLRLYREIPRTGMFPSPQAVQAAHQCVNYRWIGLEGSAVYLRQSGMAITLDGIAKGYIIDQGAETLRAFGFDDILVEVGGDMQAKGAHPWRIGIQLPTNPEQDFIRVKTVTGGALTTSGDYFNCFTADHALHHILDPRTGVSPTELSSVSISAPTACTADVLSTALMVMGVDAGLALVNTLPNVAALFVTKDQHIIASAGF